MSTKNRLLEPLLEELAGPFTFGMFMRSARVLMELSQAEMARKLDMAPGTLCDIEKGRQLVSTTLAVSIAKRLRLPLRMAVQACLQDQVAKAGLSDRVDLVAS